MNEEQLKIVHQAEKFEQNQEWSKAADCWDDLSQQVDDPEITFNSFRTLYFAKRFQEAYEMVLRYPDARINEDNGLLIIKIYLAANHYISGRMLAARLPILIRPNAEKLIKDAEQQYRKEFRVTITNCLRTFYHLGDCPLGEQQRRLAAADQLPLKEFLTGAQFLLRDPFTNPFVRSEILNMLQRLHYQQTVVMLAIDNQEYQITPNDLPTAYQVEAVRKCRQIIEKQFSNNDPQLTKTLNQQLDLQAILLIPISATVINNPDKWVRVLVGKTMGHKMPANSAIEQQWQQKINQIIEKIS